MYVVFFIHRPVVIALKPSDIKVLQCHDIVMIVSAAMKGEIHLV